VTRKELMPIWKKSALLAILALACLVLLTMGQRVAGAELSTCCSCPASKVGPSTRLVNGETSEVSETSEVWPPGVKLALSEDEG